MTTQRTHRNWLLGSMVILILANAAPAMAQQQDATELAKKAQNPVADLISVPLQSNFNFGAGFNHNKMIYVLNVQPVIPIKLTEEWNLITRVIMPIINQPNLSPSFGRAVPSTTGTGFGDFNPSFFFSPAKPGELIWGLGPTFTLPTATARNLGAGQWSMGPTGVALTIQGHWVFGALINNQWSVGGWGDKAVNALLLQPFVNYNLPDGWYLCASPVITANWKADKGGDVWTVPVGGGGGKVLHVGDQPINLQLQALGNVARPEFAPKWQLRFQIQFLFPKSGA